MTPFEIQSLLLSIVDGRHSDVVIGKLAEVCIVMARNMLATRFHRYGIVISRGGFALQDVAVMSIEDLFETRENVPCFELVHYFGAEERAGLPSEETLVHLRRLLYVKVSQTISVLAGEADPDFARILRNARDAVREERFWKQSQLFNDTVLHLANAGEAALHLPPMPEEELLNAFMRNATASASVKEQIASILVVVSEQEEYRKACSLSTICIVLRDYYRILYLLRHQESGNVAQQSETWQWNGCVDEAIDRLKASSIHAYVRRGSLDPASADGYAAAAHALLHDCLVDAPRPLFQYYHEQFPEATLDLYRANGRARFEYIMHLAKELFFELCKKNMGFAPPVSAER